MKKISGPEIRLLAAVLAVFVLALGTTEPDGASSCEELCDVYTFDVTFVNNFAKKQYKSVLFKDILLPNAVIIVNSSNKDKGLYANTFSLNSGDTKTITLEGQVIYGYTVLEMEWDTANLGIGNLAEIYINPKAAKSFFSTPRIIQTGVMLEAQTITFE